MKNAEEALERVLAGLRDGEAAAGMESRILRAVEERVSKGTARGSRLYLPGWMALWTRLAAAMSLACAVGLAALFGIYAMHPRVTRSERAAMSGVEVRSSRGETPEVSTQMAQLPSRGTRVFFAEKTASRRAGKFSGAMRSASYPAPPLPLTRQERLLVQVAHQGDAGERAMLNPGVRDVQIAREKQEFQEFFRHTTAGGEE